MIGAPLWIYFYALSVMDCSHSSDNALNQTIPIYARKINVL